MTDRSSPTTPKNPFRGALKIALVYLILGIVWILFSDNLMAFLIHEPVERIQLGIIKGWVYFVLTAGLLYALIRAETDKLQAGEKRFSKAVENLPDAFIYYDADRRVQYLNPAAMQLGSAMPLADPIGRREEEIWPGTITRQSLPRLLEAFRSGEDQKFEISGILPDEKPFSFKISYIPLQNSDRQVTGCYALIQDMTSVRQYELGLLESAERERVRAAEIETIMDAVPAFVWVTHDSKGRHISGNRATYALTHSQPGANLSKTGPEDEVLHHYTPYQKGKPIPTDELPVQHTAITGEPKRDYELDLVFEDGETLHLIGNTAPLLDANGKPAGSVAAFIDISERSQMEINLRKQEAQYRLLAENMADVIWVLDCDAMRFTYVSPSVEKLRGYTPAEVIAQTLEQCLTPDSLATVSKLLLPRIEAFRAGDPQSVTMTHELEQICQDGSTVWTEVVSTFLNNSSGGIDILGVTRDITRRLQVMEALREREARLNAVINSTDAFVWSVDRAYLLTMANTEVIRDTFLMFGYELEIGESVFKWLPIEFHPAWKSRYDRAFQGESFREEFAFTLPSGETINREYSFNPIINQEDTITGAACFGSDISERKRAEAALHDQEAQYRAVIASSSDSFCMLDRQGRVIEVNETFVRQSGFSEDELLNMSVSQVDALIIGNPNDPLEKPVKTLAMMETITQTGSALFETLLQGRNGAVWPVEVSVSYQPILGGRFFVFIRDISERKKANNALLQRTNELALLLEAGRALTSSLDLKEIFTQLYHFIARSVPCDAILISSYDRDEGLIRCRYVHDQQGECDPSAFPPIPYDPQGGDPQSLVITNGMPLLLPEYQGPQANQYAITDQDPAHDWRRHSTMLAPLIVEGKIAGVLQVLSSQAEAPTGEHLQYLEALVYRVSAALANAGLFQQVQAELLERRRAEEEVRQLNAELEQRVRERTADLSRANAGLEQAARAKDEFLASMSHELRTPLNAILTLTESLEEGTYTPVNDRHIPPLRTIAESGHHLLNLINDILDLSKIEAGKLSLIISRVEVEPVCQASMRLMRQMAQKKRLQITFEYDPSVVYLHADARCMKQMLVNLLSNAVKFTPEGGEIGLRVKADRAQGAAHFTIWDNGIGISHEHVSLLFKPFSQVDRGLDRQYGGTGLGLSLVYRMAELHGGSVSVESKPGEGSRFTISLPWSDPQTSELKAPPLFSADALAANGAGPAGALAAGGPSARPVILLAEDNYANQKTFSDYLSAHGYQVMWAANGAEAIERAHETRPDLILMDVQMPGMDGLEATRRLRLDAHLSAVPIIALTALVMPGDRERCLSAGASDYLTKPVRLKHLVEVIEIHLKGKPNETNPSHR